MKLQHILLEKLPGGVKANMIELKTDELGWWKFTLRLTDPVLQNITMKWGYVTTAIDKRDFKTKKVESYFPRFEQKVLDNIKDWVFITDRAPRKRTYGVRQVIEVEVDVIPREREQLKKPLDPKNPVKEKAVLNTRKMRLLDKVANVELYETPSEYPYEPIKKTEPEDNTGKNTGGTVTTTNNTDSFKTKTIKFSTAMINKKQPSVEKVQRHIIDKLGSSLTNNNIYKKFIEAGANDGYFGPATRSLIDMLEHAYGLPRTGNITPELMKKIG